MRKVLLGCVILGILTNGMIYADDIDTLPAAEKPDTVKSDTVIKTIPEPIDEGLKEELYEQLKGLIEEGKEEEEEKEQIDVASICESAKQDAQADVSSIMWLGAGVLTSATAVLIAYIYSPHPPVSKLLGKSPEYVAYYTECYTKAARQIQARSATIGCLAPTIAYAVCCFGPYLFSF